MKSSKSHLIDIYYDLFEILDDIEMFAEAIRHFTKCELRKSIIVLHLEYLRLHNLSEELNTLYDLKLNDLKEFKTQYNLKLKSVGYQTSIYDFLGV